MAGQVGCVQEAYNMLGRGLEKTLRVLPRGHLGHRYSSLALGLPDRRDQFGPGLQR